MEAGLTGLEIDGLAGSGVHADLEIDHAVFAEGGDHLPVAGIERDHAIAGGDVDHAVVALAVAPERKSASGELARRNGGTVAFAHAVHPDHLARSGLQRDDGPARAGGCIDDAVDHQWRAFQLVFGARAEVVGFKPPRDFEFAEVGRVDLIQRPIPGARQISGIGWPLGVFGAPLAPGRHGQRGYADGQRPDRNQIAAPFAHSLSPPVRWAAFYYTGAPENKTHPNGR